MIYNFINGDYGSHRNLPVPRNVVSLIN